ncbi:MAG: type II secretion system minor pseudopilin GspI [Stenotrophobium sp.]
MKSARGFTLIEILVAVAILAIALAAIISGMARYASEAGYLQEKTLALWVAHNRLTEMQMDPAWPPVGKSDGDVEMAGLKWKWLVVVQSTPDDRLRRVDIRVQHIGENGDLASLSAFFSSAGRGQ